MVWDEVNANNSMKWRWFIVPIKVEQINDYLFLRHIRIKQTKTIGMNEMRMNDTTWMWDETTKLGQYRRYQSRGNPGEYRLRRKRKMKKMSFKLFEKKRGRQIRYRWVERRFRRSEMMRELTKIRREIVPQDRSIYMYRSLYVKIITWIPGSKIIKYFIVHGKITWQTSIF